MNSSLRRVAIRVPIYLLIAYLTTGVYFYINQAKLLFPAPKTFESKAAPSDTGLRYENLKIPLNASDHLHAWWIPADPPAPTTILFFHGNGYVLEDMAADEAAALHSIGANLLLVDYRGYGSSSPITPRESTVNEDARAALQFLLRQKSVPAHSTFVLGRSIGSGPATQLALENPSLRGLILESPFSSIDDAAAGSWPLRFFPISLMLHTHFDNLSKITSVQMPLLVISGTADTLTPVSMAKEIFARAHQPKQLYLVPLAGHDDLLSTGGSALTGVLRNFVRQTE